MHSPHSIFRPKLFDTIKDYTPGQLGKDLVSGLIVAIIAIPLSIAFGISSGVTPSQGLLTAAVAGFIIALLGGSRVQVGGPTGAFIVIVYGIVETYHLEGLIIATLLAGIMLVLMGILRSGAVIRYIPESIIVGFTAGIAVVIFTSQLKDGLGLITPRLPAEFIPKIMVLAQSFGTFNPWALLICILTLAILFFFRAKFPRVPGAFVALIGMSLMHQGVTLLTGTPLVPTIGSNFDSVAMSIAPLDFGRITLQDIFRLLPAAMSIAFLGAIESLLSAVVADGMIGDKHRPNTELIAQGLANIASACLGGIPATGAIARTAANVRNGGRTPIAAMSHAVFLFLIIMFFSSLAAYIPMAVLAGILIYVAINMAEWKEFRAIVRTGRSEAATILITFGMTIFIDLVVAIGTGLLVSAFFFIRSIAAQSSADILEEVEEQGALDAAILPGLRRIKLSGAFFFGASALFEETVAPALQGSKAVLLDCSRLSMIDSSGIRVIKNIISNARKAGTFIMLTSVPPQVMQRFESSHTLEHLEGHGIITETDAEAEDFYRHMFTD